MIENTSLIIDRVHFSFGSGSADSGTLSIDNAISGDAGAEIIRDHYTILFESFDPISSFLFLIFFELRKSNGKGLLSIQKSVLRSIISISSLLSQSPYSFHLSSLSLIADACRVAKTLSTEMGTSSSSGHVLHHINNLHNSVLSIVDRYHYKSSVACRGLCTNIATVAKEFEMRNDSATSQWQRRSVAINYWYTLPICSHSVISCKKIDYARINRYIESKDDIDGVDGHSMKQEQHYGAVDVHEKKGLLKKFVDYLKLKQVWFIEDVVVFYCQFVLKLFGFVPRKGLAALDFIRSSADIVCRSWETFCLVLLDPGVAVDNEYLKTPDTFTAVISMVDSMLTSVLHVFTVSQFFEVLANSTRCSSGPNAATPVDYPSVNDCYTRIECVLWVVSWVLTCCTNVLDKLLSTPRELPEDCQELVRESVFKLYEVVCWIVGGLIVMPNDKDDNCKNVAKDLDFRDLLCSNLNVLSSKLCCMFDRCHADPSNTADRRDEHQNLSWVYLQRQLRIDILHQAGERDYAGNNPGITHKAQRELHDGGANDSVSFWCYGQASFNTAFDLFSASLSTSTLAGGPDTLDAGAPFMDRLTSIILSAVGTAFEAEDGAKVILPPSMAWSYWNICCIIYSKVVHSVRKCMDGDQNAMVEIQACIQHAFEGFGNIAKDSVSRAVKSSCKIQPGDMSKLVALSLCRGLFQLLLVTVTTPCCIECDTIDVFHVNKLQCQEYQSRGGNISVSLAMETVLCVFHQLVNVVLDSSFLNLNTPVLDTIYTNGFHFEFSVGRMLDFLLDCPDFLPDTMIACTAFSKSKGTNMTMKSRGNMLAYFDGKASVASNESSVKGCQFPSGLVIDMEFLWPTTLFLLSVIQSNASGNSTTNSLFTSQLDTRAWILDHFGGVVAQAHGACTNPIGSFVNIIFLVDCMYHAIRLHALETVGSDPNLNGNRKCKLNAIECVPYMVEILQEIIVRLTQSSLPIPLSALDSKSVVGVVGILNAQMTQMQTYYSSHIEVCGKHSPYVVRNFAPAKPKLAISPNFSEKISDTINLCHSIMENLSGGGMAIAPISSPVSTTSMLDQVRDVRDVVIKSEGDHVESDVVFTLNFISGNVNIESMNGIPNAQEDTDVVLNVCRCVQNVVVSGDGELTRLFNWLIDRDNRCMGDTKGSEEQLLAARMHNLDTWLTQVSDLISSSSKFLTHRLGSDDVEPGGVVVNLELFTMHCLHVLGKYSSIEDEVPRNLADLSVFNSTRMLRLCCQSNNSSSKTTFHNKSDWHQCYCCVHHNYLELLTGRSSLLYAPYIGSLLFRCVSSLLLNWMRLMDPECCRDEDGTFEKLCVEEISTCTQTLIMIKDMLCGCMNNSTIIEILSYLIVEDKDIPKDNEAFQLYTEELKQLTLFQKWMRCMFQLESCATDALLERYNGAVSINNILAMFCYCILQKCSPRNEEALDISTLPVLLPFLHIATMGAHCTRSMLYGEATYFKSTVQLLLKSILGSTKELDVVIPIRFCGFALCKSNTSSRVASAMEFNVADELNAPMKLSLQFDVLFNTSCPMKKKLAKLGIKLLQCRLVAKSFLNSVSSKPERSSLCRVTISSQQLWESLQCASICPTICNDSVDVSPIVPENSIGILDYIHMSVSPRASNTIFCSNCFSNYYVEYHKDQRWIVGKRACMELVWNCYAYQTPILLKTYFKALPKDRFSIFSQLLYGLSGERPCDSMSSAHIHVVDFTLRCFLESVGKMDDIHVGEARVTWLSPIVDLIHNAVSANVGIPVVFVVTMRILRLVFITDFNALLSAVLNIEGVADARSDISLEMKCLTAAIDFFDKHCNANAGINSLRIGELLRNTKACVFVIAQFYLLAIRGNLTEHDAVMKDVEVLFQRIAVYLMNQDLVWCSELDSFKRNQNQQCCSPTTKCQMLVSFVKTVLLHNAPLLVGASLKSALDYTSSVYCAIEATYDIGEFGSPQRTLPITPSNQTIISRSGRRAASTRPSPRTPTALDSLHPPATITPPKPAPSQDTGMDQAHTPPRRKSGTPSSLMFSTPTSHAATKKRNFESYLDAGDRNHKTSPMDRNRGASFSPFGTSPKPIIQPSNNNDVSPANNQRDHTPPNPTSNECWSPPVSFSLFGKIS